MKHSIFKSSWGHYEDLSLIYRDYCMVTFMSSPISSRGKRYQPKADGRELIPLFEGWCGAWYESNHVIIHLSLIYYKTKRRFGLYRPPECCGHAALEQAWKYKSTQCSVSCHLYRSIRNKSDTVIKMVKVNSRSPFEKSTRAWALNHLVQVLAAC